MSAEGETCGRRKDGSSEELNTTEPIAKSKIVSNEVRQTLHKGLNIISNIEQTRPDGVTFKFEGDLMYELAREKATTRAPPGLSVTSCQRAECLKTEEPTGARFYCCAKCGAKYCSRECQVSDWKKDHKAMCNQLKDMRSRGGRGGPESTERQDVVARIIGRVRLYLCPFGVCHGEVQGRGFVFLQTPNPVLELEYLRPVNSSGRKLNRSVILHFLSMGEFVDAVMQDDFELGVIREPLEAAVKTYDPKKELVLLVRARCGYMAVVLLPLVPDYTICRQLGMEYRSKDALQLNLDDT